MPSFPLARDDPFYRRLRRILDRNYPPLRRQQDSSVPISDPLYFHHKHIASNLILKAVKIAPSLPQSLVDTCDTALESFVKDGHKFNRNGYTSKNRDVRQDMHFASSVAREHIDSIGLDSMQIATKVCIHPHAPDWIKLFTFIAEDAHPRTSEPFFSEGKVLPVYKDLHASKVVPTAIHDILDSATIAKLNGFPDFLRCFGLYSFYALTQPGMTVVKRMAPTTEFPWKGSFTTGLNATSPPPSPPDATEGLVSVTKRREKTMKPPVKLESRTDRLAKRSFIRIPGRRGDFKRNYRPLSNDYIQRAWASAVAQDATFLVFNCGSYERIGVRHRETQTLHLSQLIDTSHPTVAYGKIHLGLHIAMIQDAMGRYESKKMFHNHATATRKRGALHMDDEEVSSSKRQKLGDVDLPFKLANDRDTYCVSEIEEAFASRNVVLLRLDYRQFFSPSPSAFVRLGSSCVRGLFDGKFIPESKRGGRYTSREYVTITIGAPLSHGAVGVVHKGDIEAETDTGIHRYSCLVKMVYEPEQREKLKREFEIYQHLATKNLFEGILRVHGLFQDLETHATAMVMDYGGRDLKYRGIDQDSHFNDIRLSVPQDEYDAFARALIQIHQAGIVHNDIRLENLMISNKNEVAIIDFDSAEVCENNWKFDEEMTALEDVLVVEASDNVEQSE